MFWDADWSLVMRDRLKPILKHGGNRIGGTDERRQMGGPSAWTLRRRYCAKRWPQEKKDEALKAQEQAAKGRSSSPKEVKA